jgi:hypothetical protein
MSEREETVAMYARLVEACGPVALGSESVHDYVARIVIALVLLKKRPG